MWWRSCWQNAEARADRHAASFALIPSELFQVQIIGGPARGPCDTLADAGRLHAPHLHVPARRHLPPAAPTCCSCGCSATTSRTPLGHVKYLVFYLAVRRRRGLAHAFMLPASQLPLIGASGAVAGVIGAYLILHPRVLVWVLAFRFIPLHDLEPPGCWAFGWRRRSSWC